MLHRKLHAHFEAWFMKQLHEAAGSCVPPCSQCVDIAMITIKTTYNIKQGLKYLFFNTAHSDSGCI